MFSVFDYKTMVVSSLFKANGLTWDDAGLLSVQRDGALLAFPGTTRQKQSYEGTSWESGLWEGRGLCFKLQKPSEQYLCCLFPFCLRAGMSFVINAIHKDLAVCCLLFLLIALSVCIYIISFKCGIAHV